MMETVSAIVNAINGVVWGPWMLFAILGTGLFLMIGLGGMPIRHISRGFKSLWLGRKPDGEGDIPPFNALMTSLSATIGTGNIVGVATAIYIGGPGAMFWMWCTAFVGMATKYAEAVCAVQFREVDERGKHVGGPMYYIRNGLGKNWAWLGVTFAVFGTIAGFGIGNGTQAHSVADVINSNFGVSKEITGVVMMILAGMVLVGGIDWISQVARRLVPAMAIFYLVGGLAALIANAHAIPGAFALIFKHAFLPTAAEGGFAGAAVMVAIRYGVARGIFSNEAGLGSAPIAHAAASTRGPVNQGLVAMLGTFIDTIVLCSITGLVIITSGSWTSGLNGAELSSSAFAQAIPWGNYVVAISLALFAFTTILGWSYYSERCAEFLFGVKAIMPFRILWVIAIPVGASIKLSFIWLLSDTLNALMAIPNLIALLLLSPVVFSLTRDHFRKK